MSEHKAFASLSSGLLARKGSARPAMRRQGFGQVGPGGLDDLGWNDLGDPDYPDQDNEQAMIRMAQADQLEPIDAPEGEVVDAFKRNPISMLSPATSPVHDQRDEIEKAFGYEDGEEHYDGDDIYDETAEPWDEDAESVMSLDLGVGNEAAPAFDEEPKLKRTVADLIPPAAIGEGATSPLSDFSHLPTDLANFGKPAATPGDIAAEAPQDEPVADADPTFETPAEEPVAYQAPTGFEPTEPQSIAADAAPESEVEETPVAEIPSIVDALSAFEAEEPVAEDEVAEEESVVAETVEVEEPAAVDPFYMLFASDESSVEDEAVEEAAAPDEEAAVEIDEPVAEEPVELVTEDAAFEPADQPVEIAAEEAVVVEEIAEPMPVAASLADAVADIVEPIPARTAAGKGKAAFTLRLDQDRHLKLRLACALSGQSAQKFVTEALDAYLATIPDLDELAERAPEARN